MKIYILSILLIAFFLRTQAQKKTRIDSVYYLVDTLHTPVKDRMWDINVEENSIYKNYTIHCPCLINGGSPTFFYNIKSKEIAVHITKKELKAIKLIDLSYLILKSKQIEKNAYTRDYQIFLIEPDKKGYIIHEVDFTNPNLRIVSPPDYTERKDKTN
ncbi:hypothetical protein HDF19_16060 [Mucilaginibacter sp. E4BP6]|uniref:hypothetical protein n=1 Tax=Mucilaginibacter sp. E4BP6 TaxID=2723089 RepID=UPI0015CA12EC|nr:hypothetical protein [Mucilaginibacter sp. E4BP6]NYE66600.1 HD superfamily phosphohydrolase [Mucilaginibacter sp. E4BP6]